MNGDGADVGRSARADGAEEVTCAGAPTGVSVFWFPGASCPILSGTAKFSA